MSIVREYSKQHTLVLHETHIEVLRWVVSNRLSLLTKLLGLRGDGANKSTISVASLTDLYVASILVCS